MLRAGRFRHRLLDDAFLEQQSPQAFRSVKRFVELWQKGELTDAEIASVYILIFSFLRRPQDFLGGVHNEPLPPLRSISSATCADILKIFKETLPREWHDAKSLARLDRRDAFLDYFCSVTWRSIPLAVARSLRFWEAGLYPLQLLTTIPEPEDVLVMQARGQRCLSMLIEEGQIGGLTEDGRDALGFIVHDLIHADHFFADQEKAQAQVHFCQKLLRTLELPQIQSMLTTDPVFKKEFHYLMSDMNSVPLHLLKTLKAVLLGYFKRRAELPFTSPLPAAAEAEFQTLFETVLAPWQFSAEALRAAQRLNTPLYKGRVDAETLHRSLSVNFGDVIEELC